MCLATVAHSPPSGILHNVVSLLSDVREKVVISGPL